MALAYLLPLLVVAYIVVAIVVRKKQRALGLSPPTELRRVIWVGIAWVNGPSLPLLLLPLFLQQRFALSWSATASAAILAAGFFAGGLGGL